MTHLLHCPPPVPISKTRPENVSGLCDTQTANRKISLENNHYDVSLCDLVDRKLDFVKPILFKVTEAVARVSARTEDVQRVGVYYCRTYDKAVCGGGGGQ